ncbi:hypothetical protein QQX98_008930 [Neonectria punicea]|uniref:Uncharacterized protein n=1 Tax=Neonectria punicea TaxID=979145 RepID=A0ABR1GTX7_9HYPO
MSSRSVEGDFHAPLFSAVAQASEVPLTSSLFTNSGLLDLGSFTACEPDAERTEYFIVQFTANAHQAFLHGSPRVDMLLSLAQFASECADTAAYNSLPTSLRPTHLQLTVSHHPWIDILPWPEIRDNLLRHDEESYDNKELCRDLRGFQAVTFGCGGMIAWGDPWDSQRWEVTEAFAAKWSRLSRTVMSFGSRRGIGERSEI